MRQIRIYQADTLIPGQLFELSEDAGQHIGVVLRMQPGDMLVLFCGDNREYTACIETVHKKKVCVRIQSEAIANKESPVRIHLVQSISKGDRMEWAIQKAVELGVSSITPLISMHCAVKMDASKSEKKWNQWQAIAIAACEQCGRNQIPEVKKPINFEDYMNREKSGCKLILHPEGAQSLKDYVLEAHEIEVMIGPEGGFSEMEIEKSINAGFMPWKLGPRILRTETAAIVALSLLQAARGDL